MDFALAKPYITTQGQPTKTMFDQFSRFQRWLLRVTQSGGVWFRSAFQRVISVANEAAHRTINTLNNRAGRKDEQDVRSCASAHGEDLHLSRPEGPLLPDGDVVYAIGDVHGRADLLSKLLDKIETDSASFEKPPSIVFLGDYIDRGLQSRQVIDTLLSDRLDSFESYYLKGNHEDALLSFLSDPSFGPKWAAYGGRETLVSYGVRPPRSLSFNIEWEEVHDAFLKAIPNTHQALLRSMPTSVQIGGYGFAHAGLRPGKKFAEQNDHDLMWIRDEFLNENGTFDVMVVHGHTPVDQPHNDHRRINVDTGAYFTGRLTAAKLTGNDVAFIATDT